MDGGCARAGAQACTAESRTARAMQCLPLTGTCRAPVPTGTALQSHSRRGPAGAQVLSGHRLRRKHLARISPSAQCPARAAPPACRATRRRRRRRGARTSVRATMASRRCTPPNRQNGDERSPRDHDPSAPRKRLQGIRPAVRIEEDRRRRCHEGEFFPRELRLRHLPVV
jgi:hypothetical protein